ncbi:MAG: DUF4011 domain-containing protein, partial [Methanothermobacter wolfeii]|nr:DUF4011 domain-containing protein [Methanothermobacter wolfeii]
MESPAKEIIEREFERLREKLLDLTMRNQLLNFRPRSRTIEVVNHDPSHIYGYLVLNERKMKFAPRPEAPEDCGEEELWEYPSSEEDADGIPQEEGHQAHHQPDDNVLQTDLTGSELQRRLFYINQRARTMIQEQGYNILYLALGFLEWRTPDEPDI